MFCVENSLSDKMKNKIFYFLHPQELGADGLASPIRQDQGVDVRSLLGLKPLRNLHKSLIYGVVKNIN